MKSLGECLVDAEKRSYALGHFNVSNFEMVRAVFSAAQKLLVPIIIGVSEGESNYLGLHQIGALVRSFREEFDFPIFINADHTRSFERAKEAIDAGYDSVVIDGSELPLEENMKLVKKVVEYSALNNPDILIEGEIGFIGKSSEIIEKLPPGVSIDEKFLTKPEEAVYFVKETGINLLSPAIGSIHGMFEDWKSPPLNIERIKAIKKVVEVPLVLHGGSGQTEKELAASVKAGISIIHISTELRAVFRRELSRALEENPDEVTPYKYMKNVVKTMESLVERKIEIFSGRI